MGLIKTAYEFYKSAGWIKCRRAYAASVGGVCERCKERGLYVLGEEVHHKIRLTADNLSDPDIALNWDNLELLCKDCHHEEHGRHEKRYEITEDGRVVLK